MEKFPTDVVMAMVAGVFLPFALNRYMDARSSCHCRSEYRCIPNFDNFQVCWAVLPTDVWGVINGYVSGRFSGDGPVISPVILITCPF